MLDQHFEVEKMHLFLLRTQITVDSDIKLIVMYIVVGFVVGFVIGYLLHYREVEKRPILVPIVKIHRNNDDVSDLNQPINYELGETHLHMFLARSVTDGYYVHVAMPS